MQEKIKNVIIVIEFITILFVIFLINIVKQPKQISLAERRYLTQFPEINFNSIFSGKVSNDFEKYAVDQFTFRDNFRTFKFWFTANILKQKDNDKLFTVQNSIYKMEYPLNEIAIENSAEKTNNIYQKYLQGMNVYYSIIPDKTYYLNDEHLVMDYSKIENILKSKLENMQYIDIKDSLTVECFYKTDLHWKQESILNTVNIIKKNMNLECQYADYNEKDAGIFYGVYSGQVGTTIEPDIIKYLTNDILEACITYNYETEKQGKIYDLDKYSNSQDKYDIYLSGATPLITIDNPIANSDKELLLFRDSFGSSLAPLLVDNYKKITLIDMRYINSSLLEKYITFANQDVLFLYSGIILNQNILR